MGRKMIKLYDANVAAAGTVKGDWRKVDGIAGPFQIVVRTSDVGTAPVTPSHTVDVEGAAANQNQEPADIVAIDDTPIVINGPAAITAAGDTARQGTSEATQVPLWLRASIVTTFGTPNDGTKVEVWLVGVGK